MTLQGTININGHPLTYWSAVNRGPVILAEGEEEPPPDLRRYECTVVDALTGVEHRFEILHRRSEGARSLAAKLLEHDATH